MAISFGTASSVASFSGETGPKNLGVTLTQAGAIAIYAAGESFTSLTTVSIGGVSGIKPIDLPYSNSNGARLLLGLAEGLSAGSYTPTVTFSQAVFGHAIAIPVYGAAPFNGTNDPVKTANATSTTPATGTGSTISRPNSAILAAFGDSGNAWTGATSPPNFNGSTTGSVNVYSNLTTTNLPCVFAYKLVTGSTTAPSSDVGTTASSPWGAGLLVLVEAAAAGGGLALLGVG